MRLNVHHRKFSGSDDVQLRSGMLSLGSMSIISTPEFRQIFVRVPGKEVIISFVDFLSREKVYPLPLPSQESAPAQMFASNVWNL